MEPRQDRLMSLVLILLLLRHLLFLLFVRDSSISRFRKVSVFGKDERLGVEWLAGCI